MRILAAAIGNCVHAAGIQSFLELAKSIGNETIFLGQAVPIKSVVRAIREHKPDMVALSYRLSPESARALLAELGEELEKDPSLKQRRFVFGGTPPVARLAKETGLFEAVFQGGEPMSEIVALLKGVQAERSPVTSASSTLVQRIESVCPLPLVRHHFGLPSLEETVKGARKIAESGMVDILSIAPDQNAQEFFFRPERMDPRLDGAGGVPIRRPEDLREIYKATRTGNHPLLRCYSGTRDLVRWAEMLKETIDIAWGAVPLSWYSELDGRSDRPLREAIAENQEAIRWYASHGIPVEVTESHQWALRRSGDTIEVATAYIAAHNAKALGCRDYVCQFMFDTPRGTSPAMDLAKMFAKLQLIEPLADASFRIIRMVRPGLASFSTDAHIAKGQLAASVYTAMALNPHIVHVVGFSEADHAATADEVIESCGIARGAIQRALLGLPRPEADPRVAARKNLLVAEATFLIDAIKRLDRSGSKDPLTSPDILALAVKEGLLDASDLAGSRIARGRIVTSIVDGACIVVDKSTGEPLPEQQRVKELAVSEEDLDLAEI